MKLDFLGMTHQILYFARKRNRRRRNPATKKTFMFRQHSHDKSYLLLGHPANNGFYSLFRMLNKSFSGCPRKSTTYYSEVWSTSYRLRLVLLCLLPGAGHRLTILAHTMARRILRSTMIGFRAQLCSRFVNHMIHYILPVISPIDSLPFLFYSPL